MTFLSSVGALFVTVSVIAFILYSKFGKLIQDVPNERSMHSNPVPRTGGIGLILGVLAGWHMLAEALPWWVWLPSLLLFAVSLLDDIRNLPVWQRLLAHLLAAALLVAGFGADLHAGWAVAILLFFFTVWMTNLYNFMDGSDGLAGGMALFGFGSYGIAALLSQDDVVAWSSFAVAGAALGFLFFNFHPAKIFMGDAGSIPLGFLAAALGIWGWLRGDWSLWFPLIVFSPFIVDATVTLGKRTLRGAKITEAHREHYYQRAIQMGLGHRNLAWVEYALMVGAGGLALWTRQQSFPWGALLGCAVVYSLCMLLIDFRWKEMNRVSS